MAGKGFAAGCGAFIGMLVLILDSKTALEGANAGIYLCMTTVIPSLFPFLVLSGLLTSALSGGEGKLLRPAGKLLGIPKGCESIVISGFLGGYPVGAQAAGALVRQGTLERHRGEAMLAFCNNAGPAFIFGMAASLFPGELAGWYLWGIHIVSALLSGWILTPKGESLGSAPQRSDGSLTDALKNAVKIMGMVCGWVVLFRIVAAFLTRWGLWYLSAPFQAAVIGALELSNGCIALNGVGNLSARFVLCSAMLAQGGLCVTMQTMSAAKGLSLRYYYLGKLLQTIFSIVLAMAVTAGVFPIAAVGLIGIAGFLGFFKNRDSIIGLSGV